MDRTDEWHLLGCRGWGSTLVEAFLALCEAPLQIEYVDGFDKPGETRNRLLSFNPLAQVPTLLLPGDGGVMTESGAIALYLSERFPAAPLAPAVDHDDRAGFLRLLFWLTSAVYPTFTYSDYPERFVDSEPARLRERVIARRQELWKQLEGTLGSTGWTLRQFSALDVYLTVMTRWNPGREWFATFCPKLHALALRGDSHPVLGPVVARNFD